MTPANRSFLQTLVAFSLIAAHAGGEELVRRAAPASAGASREFAVGDEFPDAALVNELGEKTRIADFRGKALAITFIYSRCPAPTYCPLVSRNFDTTQELLTRLGACEHCHLLSISMDSENDTSETLAAYAKSCQADARFWTFARAPAEEIRRLGNAVGLEFRRTEGRIDHNLRTVVIDAAGRIRKVFRGNEWTPQELAAELRDTALAGR